jgi:hypothetical protein
MAAEFGIHLNQLWHVEVRQGQALTELEAIDMAASAGAKSIRFDVNWADVQTSSDIAFSHNSFAMSDEAFSRYLKDRGYGENGDALEWIYSVLQKASSRDQSTIVNLNTMPDWAKRNPDEPYKGINNPKPRAFYLSDNRKLGEFVFDLIVFCARKPGGEGLEVLRAIQGFQIFNEVAGWTQEFNPGYGFDPEVQLPYAEYFQILDDTMAMVERAFTSISFRGNRPPVLGPNLAGTYTPYFWNNLARYVPRNKESTAANGKLRLEGISLHPYGITVRPDIDLLLEDAEQPIGYYGVNGAYELLNTHLTFNRIMQPTDDWLSMLAMIDRDPEKSTAWNLYRYSGVPDPARKNEDKNDQNFTADQYYDRGSELGVERTLAQLNELSLEWETVHFTEFGASSYSGGKGENSLRNTNFADPYRYGYYPQNKPLPKAVAENLQAEAMVQSLGLFDSWDFLSTATVFTFFDRGQPGYVEQFGLARNRLKKDLTPDWTLYGQAYVAFMNGNAFSERDLLGNDLGVDLHIAARGKRLKRTPSAHETILLRGDQDTLDGEAGDDVIFGAAGSDELAGGEGYDKLYGGEGNDKLSGGKGDDRLKGDSGDDSLTGGQGRDNFVFSSYSKKGSGNPGHDVIEDFDTNADRVTLIGLEGGKSDIPAKLVQTEHGVLFTWTGTGATILLRGIKKSDLSGRHFHVLR